MVEQVRGRAMKINDDMNPDNSICPDSDDWIGTLYSITIQAATASTLKDIDECQRWCTNVQGQALKIINRLSADEEMHREMKAEGKDNNLEFIEANYNDLIQFIAGAGMAVSEVSDRLRDSRHTVEENQLRAMAGAKSRALS